jgi:DNA-binding transcriptional LysR family regulator
MAQPPLSQQIQLLEKELGVQLFFRTKRRVQLTEAGQAFLKEVQQILVHVEQAVQIAQRAQDGKIGTLHIGFVGSSCYGILPLTLHRFRARYSEVEVTLQELTATEQVQALHQHHIHLGLFRPPMPDDALQTETLLQEALVVALPAHHPLAPLPLISVRALATEPFILFPVKHAPGFYHQIIGFCLDAGFIPKIVQEAIEMQTIVSLVAAGMGVSLVPASLMNLQRADVVYKALMEKTPLVELAMVWRTEDSSPVLRQFLAVAREVSREIKAREEV